MESDTKEKRRVNPRQTANIVSRITFWYIIKLLRKGIRKELEEQDLYEVTQELETKRIGEQFQKEWDLHKHQKHPLFLVFWKLFGIPFVLLSISVIVLVAKDVIQPLIISKLVFYFTPGQTETTKFDIYLFSILWIIFYFISVYTRQNYMFHAEALAIKVRTAICFLIYTKCIKLRVSKLQHISLAKIASLITKDVNVLDQNFLHMTYTTIGLPTLIITIFNMFQYVGGVPTLVPLAAVLVFLPLQVLVGLWIASLKRATSEKTDIRIDYLQKVLSSIRSTKMYVWEKYLEKKITQTRIKEMDILLKMFNVLFLTIVTAIIFNNVTFYLTLMTHVWLGIPMKAETMYFITGVFLSVSFNLGTTFPYGTFYTAQVIAAIKRMQNLLLKLEKYTEKKTVPINESSSNPKIKMHNAVVEIDEKVVLNNLSIDIKRGLTLVTGHASSGKSVLLITILKEFELSSGSLTTEGTLSYASQEPWLFPSTIRQNIIFGSEYDEKRYQEVIKACSLQYDFDGLEKGDLTIVADRGINLSKGQQSRINLARAIYKECDIYLLDDCLSSLDSLVARSIFVNCILNFLHDKIVVLVTYNTNLAPYATNMIKLERGAMKVERNMNPKTENMLEESSFCKKNSEEETDLEEKDSVLKSLIPINPKNKIYGEEKRTGAVSLQVYKSYITLGGGALYAFMIFCLFILTQFFVSYKDKLISQWANIEDNISALNSTNSSQYFELIEQRNNLLYQYTFSIAGLSVTTLIRAYSLFTLSKRVSINLHKKMLHSVLNASLRFFDSTFIGNIVNRFSKDLVTVDENIPFPMLHLTAIVFETIGNFLLISSTNLRFLIPTVLLFIFVLILRSLYLRVGRPLKRLDASTKSPVIGYLNATLEGLLSIKVFRAEKLLKDEFERHHNLYNSASYSHLCCLKAFVLTTDTFVAIFIGIVILQFVIFDEGVLPGDVGLAISQSFMMGGVLYYAFYKLADLETQMTSMERAVDYVNIQQEKKVGRRIDQWPKKSEIKYENVSLSLNNSKSFLLKNINFVINSKEKIGIVGRTGAGKSSIISVLFRLYDFEGRITIDDVDIKTLSLDFLRSKISVIPQDPVLFHGTVRENIDPEGVYEDDEIWKSLGTVNLKNFIPKLDIDVKDLDFTCGQTQLVCLARVLIKKNRILVLDELVENVDSETENFINTIINQNFTSCTVIKIAHKLKFVMDCDKILVLNKSEIVEYDSPQKLLENKSGLFHKMVKFGGVELQED